MKPSDTQVKTMRELLNEAMLYLDKDDSWEIYDKIETFLNILEDQEDEANEQT